MIAPAWWSIPWALTEIEPPTVKMSVDCIALTAKRGWIAFWMSCHDAPEPTVTVEIRMQLDAVEPTHVEHDPAALERLSPMLWRTPAGEIVSPAARAWESASATSFSLRGATIPATAVRLRQLASLTVPPFCSRPVQVWPDEPETRRRSAAHCRSLSPRRARRRVARARPSRPQHRRRQPTRR